MIDSPTARDKLAAMAAAMPSHRDYPIHTRQAAQRSLLELLERYKYGHVSALGFVPIYQSITAAIKRYEAIDWWEQRYDMERAMETYAFNVKGGAADAQTWEVSGEVNCAFGNVFDTVMNAAFEMLTDGKAIYGKPGIGCQGPYSITALHVDAVVGEQQDAREQAATADTGDGSSPWTDRSGGAEPKNV